jgi:hypothetical protein
VLELAQLHGIAVQFRRHHSVLLLYRAQPPGGGVDRRGGVGVGGVGAVPEGLGGEALAGGGECGVAQAEHVAELLRLCA